MKILIVYASKHGQTAKIAASVASAVEQEGAEVRAFEVSLVPRDLDPRAYDAVIVAGPVYYGRFTRPLRKYIVRNAKVLTAVRNALVAVSLSAKFDPPNAEKELHKIVAETGWLPETFTLVAGAESFTKYGWFTGYVMRKIARERERGGDFTKDREYTDWNALAAFAREFVAKVKKVSASAVAAQP